MFVKAAKVIGGAFMFGMSYVIMWGGCLLIAAGFTDEK